MLTRMWHNKRSIALLPTSVQSALVNWRVIPMVLAEALHIFSMRKLKMQTRQSNKWMGPNWKDRNYQLTDMKRKKPEVDNNPSSTISLLVIYPPEQMRPSCEHYSKSSERLNQSLYRRTTRVVLEILVSSASRILKLLKRPQMKWIKSKSVKTNSLL